MNEANIKYTAYLELEIIKLCQFINDTINYRANQQGVITATKINGILPIWCPEEDGLFLQLDTPSITYMTIRFKYECMHLADDDVHIWISPKVHDPTEIMEAMLVGIHRLLYKFDGGLNAS